MRIKGMRVHFGWYSYAHARLYDWVYVFVWILTLNLYKRYIISCIDRTRWIYKVHNSKWNMNVKIGRGKSPKYILVHNAQMDYIHAM